MTDPVDIRQLVNLPPDEAIRFLDAKGYRVSVDWRDTWQDEHASAFTVAKVARVDLLREIHVSLLDAMASGQTFDDWKAGLQPRLEAAGWWGRVVDPDITGTADPVIVGPRRLRTIYDTNLRMARATALWGRIEAGKAAMPYLRYSAVLDGRTRPQHRAWHDIVLPVDHPWWRTHFPPNGWNCRCTAVQMNDRMLARRGLKVTENPPEGPPVAYLRRGGGAPEFAPAGIDPGFAYNPGRARARLVLEKAADSLTRAAGVPGLIEPALADIIETLPGGRPDRARIDAMIALARAGQVAELAALLAEMLGVATASADAGDLETAARGGKQGGKKRPGKTGSRPTGGRIDQKREPDGRFAQEKNGAPFGEKGYKRLADGPPGRMLTVAKLDNRTQAAIGARGPDVLLSGATASKQRRDHKDIAAADYGRLNWLFSTGRILRDRARDNHFRLVQIDGDRRWYAVVKITAKRESMLVSFRQTNARNERAKASESEEIRR